ncbi:MAG: glycerol-3-phosphate 1-O-acyltransferase PlsY [Candidatus Omnitrophica bacterium]|nr:glycerol-3-phosphate 1-O-acyltransferase PlsY [Candidatus Omnitrophota bacterium]
MRLILGILISYLIGAIPTAYIWGKVTKGIDIRRHGSGNVGATNVFRVLGKQAGVIVLLIDILKGVVPTAIVADALGQTEMWQRILISLCAVGGHNWTVFLNFKGGKGIATSLGVLIGLACRIPSIRMVLLGTVTAWIACFLSSGIVSFSSIVAAVCLPVLMVWTGQPFALILLGVIFCLFVVIRHKANIKRLIALQEPRVKIFGRK